MKKFLIVISLIFISLLTFNTTVSAATTQVKYVTTSIGQDASTEMLINYHAWVEGTVVEYTVKSDTNYANKKTATPTYSEWSRPAGDYSAFGARYVCKVNLSNLTPDTEYRYRVKTPSGAYSDEYYFKTASGYGPVTFAFLTDSQAGVNDYGIFNTLIAKSRDIKRDTAFILHTGDVTDRGGNPEQWEGFYSKSTNLSLMPIASTPGNHEYYLTSSGDYVSAEVYNQFFNNPQNGPEIRKNSSYYFTYNNVLFVMIDSVKSDSYAEQKAWFREVVSNNMRRAIIVGMHIGPFTGGGAYASSGQNVFNQWSALFDEFNVDLVLSGHEHNFAPSKTIYKRDLAPEGFGTNYVVGPASGTKTGGFNKNFVFTNGLTLGELFLNEQVGTTAMNFTRSGIVITAGGNETELVVYNQNGQQFTYRIPVKRPSLIQDISKKDFMKTIKIEHDEEVGRAKVVWSEDAYGNVKTVKVTNGIYFDEVFISVPKLVEQDLGPVYEGNVYNVTVEVTFNDGSVEEKQLVLNLSGEEPVDPNPKPNPTPVGCQMGSTATIIFGLVSGLAGVVFVLRRKHS